jgi:hypothetical protein
MNASKKEFEEVIRQMEDFLNILNKSFCHEGKQIWDKDGKLNEDLKSRLLLIGEMIESEKIRQNGIFS